MFISRMSTRRLPCHRRYSCPRRRMPPPDFRLAGVAAALSAIAGLPLLAVSVASGLLPDNAVLDLIFNTLALVNAGLTIYMLWALRQLLNLHGFHATDVLLTLSIAGNAIVAVGQVLAEFAEETLTLGLGMIALAAAISLITLALGIKLLPAAPLVRGPMTPFAYALIATGVCVASVVLSPLGMLSWVVASVALAVIFFRASEASPAEGAG